jgi:hypothetical protein
MLHVFWLLFAFPRGSEESQNNAVLSAHHSFAAPISPGLRRQEPFGLGGTFWNLSAVISLKSNGRSRLIHRPLLSQAFEGRNFRNYVAATPWNILRCAPEPMTARQIADALAERCGLSDLSPAKHKALMTKVRNMLALQDGRTVTGDATEHGKLWRVA